MNHAQRGRLESRKEFARTDEKRGTQFLVSRLFSLFFYKRSFTPFDQYNNHCQVISALNVVLAIRASSLYLYCRKCYNFLENTKTVSEFVLLFFCAFVYVRYTALLISENGLRNIFTVDAG